MALEQSRSPGSSSGSRGILIITSLLCVVCLALCFSSCGGGEPDRTVPELGASVRTAKSGPCVDTQNGLNEAHRWIGVDEEKVAAVINEHGGELLDPDHELEILDRVAGLGVTKVRVERSGRECYIPSELVMP